MQTVEHLRGLFDYNDWANRRILVAVRESGSDRCREILAHLLTAQAEWFARVYGKNSTGMDFWPDLSIDECGALAREMAESFEKLLRRFEEEGLDLSVKYFSSSGLPYVNTFREVMSHVLLHSAIHRGNIVFRLREEGFDPPLTDYIYYLRETKYL